MSTNPNCSKTAISDDYDPELLIYAANFPIRYDMTISLSMHRKIDLSVYNISVYNTPYTEITAKEDFIHYLETMVKLCDGNS